MSSAVLDARIETLGAQKKGGLGLVSGRVLTWVSEAGEG